ncbi:hypothetical protein [Larkinella arboricola]
MNILTEFFPETPAAIGPDKLASGPRPLLPQKKPIRPETQRLGFGHIIPFFSERLPPKNSYHTISTARRNPYSLRSICKYYVFCFYIWHETWKPIVGAVLTFNLNSYVKKPGYRGITREGEDH